MRRAGAPAAAAAAARSEPAEFLPKGGRGAAGSEADAASRGAAAQLQVLLEHKVVPAGEPELRLLLRAHVPQAAQQSAGTRQGGRRP